MGVETYQKMYSIYTEKGCNEFDKNDDVINFTLEKQYTKDGNGQSIKDSCRNTREYLIKTGSELANASNNWTDHIKATRDPYIKDHGNLANDYNTLLNHRYQLDQDTQKLLGVDSSLYEKQNILDSAVFTTLLWTVLATSVLYYTFIKI